MFTIVAVGLDFEGRSPPPVVTAAEARAYFNKYSPPIPYFEASSRTGQNVSEAVESLIRCTIRDIAKK